MSVDPTPPPSPPGGGKGAGGASNGGTSGGGAPGGSATGGGASGRPPSDRDLDVLLAAARAVAAAFQAPLADQALPVRAAAALHLLHYALQPYGGSEPPRG